MSLPNSSLNLLGVGLAPTSQTVESLLKTPGWPSWGLYYKTAYGRNLLDISSFNDWQAREWKFDKLLKSNIKIKKVLDSLMNGATTPSITVSSALLCWVSWSVVIKQIMLSLLYWVSLCRVSLCLVSLCEWHYGEWHYASIVIKHIMLSLLCSVS